MNDYDDYDMKPMLNTTIMQQFLANGIIDEKMNKLFTGERSNIKHKSFKEQLALRLRHSNLRYNKREGSRLRLKEPGSRTKEQG